MGYFHQFCGDAGEGQCRGQIRKRRVLDSSGTYTRRYYQHGDCDGHCARELRKDVKRGEQAALILAAEQARIKREKAAA